jgi:hypothetical protein
MKNAFLVSTVMLALAASVADAKTYVFSYTDSMGDVLSGTFTGSLKAPTHIKLSFNGAALSGPFTAYGYACSTTEPGTGGVPPNCGNAGFNNSPVVSFKASDNDFYFGNAPVGSGDYFYIIQPWSNPNGSSQPLAEQALVDGSIYPTSGYNGTYIPANWSLRVRKRADDSLAVTASSVPELSTWGMSMLGFAGLGFAAHRSRKFRIA